MPLWPLIASLAAQTLATMALFSLPAIAPAVASTLHVSGELVGLFVAIAYGVGIVSALLSPGFIHRYGSVRALQGVLIATAAMLLLTAGGSIAWLGAAAVVLGLGYGAAAPASTHLLVPQTPPRVFNMVMSLRQIGVPLGGVLGSLLLPPLVLRIGWRETLLAEIPAVLLLIALLQIPRRQWDTNLQPGLKLIGLTLLAPFRLLQAGPMLRLSIASFIYSGTQLCFVAFMTTQLTSTVHFDLVSAGRALALYQIAGAATRPVWGWIADRWISPTHTLALHGFGMAAAAVAAGAFTPRWSHALVLLVVAVAGGTAGGYTGVAYAEYAHLGGTRRTEATGLGTAVMFAGVLLIPPSFGAAVAASGGYTVAYTVLAALAFASAVLLSLAPCRCRAAPI
ncbi:MAG TPA: MFS transporter [Acetobacteraceae bacterium]|jgi:MFS family permease|nr:MFS transporter [Acetobacteraceae bacterium]